MNPKENKEQSLSLQKQTGLYIWETSFLYLIIISYNMKTNVSNLLIWRNVLFQTDSLSRDIYALAGGAPPIAFVKPTFKTKYNTKQNAKPWYCILAFNNKWMKIAPSYKSFIIWLGFDNHLPIQLDLTILFYNTGYLNIKITMVYIDYI